MLGNALVSLVTETQGKDQYGEPAITTTTKQVMANRQSIGRNEFYQAQTAGYKPVAQFEIRAIEYDGQTKLTHEGITYDIIRTYSKNGEMIELICQRGVR